MTAPDPVIELLAVAGKCFHQIAKPARIAYQIDPDTPVISHEGLIILLGMLRGHGVHLGGSDRPTLNIQEPQ